MTNIVNLVERQIIAAFDAAFVAKDTWPLEELRKVIRELVPYATDNQIWRTLKAARRCDPPATWL
jgi:hypothetical protein